MFAEVWHTFKPEHLGAAENIGRAALSPYVAILFPGGSGRSKAEERDLQLILVSLLAPPSAMACQATSTTVSLSRIPKYTYSPRDVKGAQIRRGACFDTHTLSLVSNGC